MRRFALALTLRHIADHDGSAQLSNQQTGIEETELRDRLRPYLESLELEATVERHRALVNHLEHLIDERGESAVLFDLNA